MAMVKYIFDVINQIDTAMIIGKLKNIIKLNITLIFKKNIRKYNFIVCLRFSIVTFDDNHIDSKTFLFSITMKYLE
jgi:hypothetical protein